MDDSIITFEVAKDGYWNFPVGTRVKMRLVHIFDMRDGKIAKEIVIDVGHPVAAATGVEGYRYTSVTGSAAFSRLLLGNVEVIRSFVAYPGHFTRLRLATGFGGRYAADGIHTLDALHLTEYSGPRS